MTFKAIHAGSIRELAEKTWITTKESKSVTKDPICGMTVDEGTAPEGTDRNDDGRW